MPETVAQSFNQVSENVLHLEHSITEPICEGMNVLLASFQALYLQYQKHHFVVEGAEFYSLHNFFQESSNEVKDHVHELGERLNGLGGVPASSFTKLAELCCFSPESDDAFNCRTMVEHDLAAEQSLIDLLRRQTSQAESLGDRGTRFLYEKILIGTEERAYHLAHFLASDTLVQM